MDTFVRTFWKDCCAICGCQHIPGEASFPIDHWQPLSKGHILEMTNAVLLCKNCNSRKRDRNPEDIYSANIVAGIENQLEKQAADWNLSELMRKCAELDL